MRANTILDTIGQTSHVKANRLFPSSHSVWIKLERGNPGGSIKDRIAVEMSLDRKSTRLNSSHTDISRMPTSA